MQLRVADTQLCYPLHIHAITEPATLLDDDNLTVKCFRTNHRIECYGFVFNQKRQPRKLDPVKAGAYDIPVSFYNQLKDGEDYTRPDGTVIKK